MSHNILENTSLLTYHKNKIINNLDTLGMKNLVDRIKENFQDNKEANKITIAFIGQYSAGKSTIISALTGNSSIKVSADVATEYTTQYEWNDIVSIIDTPGLYTENKEHDERTSEAIDQSDMLVYCITNELFDQRTVEDYKVWAYEKGYKNKMFLIINKMSREFGSFDQLVKNYTESINEVLSPHSITDVEYTFIDAKDYIDGREDEDLEILMEESHFEDFIIKLNQFAIDKGYMARIARPYNNLINIIDDFNASEIKNQIKNWDETEKTLERILNSTKNTLNQIELQSYTLINQSTQQIINESNSYYKRVMTSEEEGLTTEIFQNKIENIINGNCLVINHNISELFENSMNDLNNDVQDKLGSLDKKMSINIGDLSQINSELYEEKDSTNVDELLKKVGNPKIVSLFKKNGFKLSGKLSDASGTGLHKVIKDIGSRTGKKFKPWEAVKYADKIGKAMTFVGVGLDIVGLVAEEKENIDQDKAIRERETAEKEFKTEIHAIVNELNTEYKREIKTQLNDVLNSVKRMKSDNKYLFDRQREAYNQLVRERNYLNDLVLEKL